MFNPGWFISK